MKPRQLLVVEPLLRRHPVVETLRHISVPVAVGEPLLMSPGAFAAIVAIVTLVLTSIASQGAHLPFLIAASLLAGVWGVLVSFAAASIEAAA